MNQLKFLWPAIAVGITIGTVASVSVYLSRSILTFGAFADVYYQIFVQQAIVELGLPILVGLIAAVPVAEMASGGAFRSMWCRVDRRSFLRRSLGEAMAKGFTAGFVTIVTIAIAVMIMSTWGSGFLFRDGPLLVEGFHSAEGERLAWYRMGGFLQLFSSVSPGFALFAVAAWVGVTGAIYALFAASLALVIPWPRLAFLAPTAWLIGTVLATGSLLYVFGWINPASALYPWLLNLLMIPGRMVGLGIYLIPLAVSLYLVWKRTETIVSMQ